MEEHPGERMVLGSCLMVLLGCGAQGWPALILLLMYLSLWSVLTQSPQPAAELIMIHSLPPRKQDRKLNSVKIFSLSMEDPLRQSSSFSAPLLPSFKMKATEKQKVNCTLGQPGLQKVKLTLEHSRPEWHVCSLLRSTLRALHPCPRAVFMGLLCLEGRWMERSFFSPDNYFKLTSLWPVSNISSPTGFSAQILWADWMFHSTYAQWRGTPQGVSVSLLKACFNRIVSSLGRNIILLGFFFFNSSGGRLKCGAPAPSMLPAIRSQTSLPTSHQTGPSPWGDSTHG